MDWPDNVARWRPIVQAELTGIKNPLPVDLILATIKIESAGQPGIVNPKSGASGLMQVMPGTLQTYNQNHPAAPVSLSTLRSPSGGPEQIKVGIWVLSQYWKNAYQYLEKRLPNVPVDELARISDLFYVAGPGATKARLDRLSSPSWASIQQRYPKWNALPHPRNVFQQLTNLQWPTEKISVWLGTTGGIIDRPPVAGFAMGAVMIMLAWYFLSRKEGTNG